MKPIGNVMGGLAISLILGGGLCLAPTCPGAESEKSPAAKPPPTQALAAAQALSDAFAWVADTVKPAVVSIYSTKFVSLPKSHPWFSVPQQEEEEQGENQEQDQDAPKQHRGKGKDRKYKQQGVGCGVILDKAGFILTSNHVVKGMDELKVRLADKREFDAKIIGTDPKTDLAVIKIEGKDLPWVPMGDSDKLRVGDWVIAIGSPYDLPQTVTAGIVSAKGRGKLGITDYEDFIQTDAAINTGNSGGPLLTIEGKIIGINTAIFSTSGGSTGVGFAIPESLIRNILPTLRAGQSVARGQLGVRIGDITEELAEHFKLKKANGALVEEVVVGSAAEKAEIRRGDVITEVNGKEVEDVSDLRNRVAAITPGTKATVLVVRDGKEVKLPVVVGQAKEIETAAAEPAEEASSATTLGMKVSNLTPDLEQKLQLKGEKGVVVTEVDQSSTAYEKGIREGNLILEVNRKAVNSINEFEKAVKDSAKGSRKSVLLLVKNGEGNRYIVLGKK